MADRRGPAETYNTFHHLLKELDSFIDTSNIKLAFDKDGNTYLMGANFSEPLKAQTTSRQERDEMRAILAKYVPRIEPVTPEGTE